LKAEPKPFEGYQEKVPSFNNEREEEHFTTINGPIFSTGHADRDGIR